MQTQMNYLQKTRRVDVLFQQDQARSRSEQVRKRNNRVKRTDDAFWNYFEFIENVIVCGKDRSAHVEF